MPVYRTMTEARNSLDNDGNTDNSFLSRVLSGGYGLAITYWAFYFLGAGLFFVFGSRAVDDEKWIPYLIMVAVMLAYTALLVVISRTSSVFMIINILIGISTLGFVY